MSLHHVRRNRSFCTWRCLGLVQAPVLLHTAVAWHLGVQACMTALRSTVIGLLSAVTHSYLDHRQLCQSSADAQLPYRNSFVAHVELAPKESSSCICVEGGLLWFGHVIV